MRCSHCYRGENQSNRTMTEHRLSDPLFENTMRLVCGTLTVGLLIVLPALKILGLL
jgi:hypothetical protein